MQELGCTQHEVVWACSGKSATMPPPGTAVVTRQTQRSLGASSTGFASRVVGRVGKDERVV
jgi:hypothetical protein